MANTEGLLKNIYKINEEVKDTREKSESTIGDKYDALEKESEVKAGINLTIPETDVVADNQSSTNSLENFKQAATLGEVKKVAAVENSAYFTENELSNENGGRVAA